MRVSGFPHNCAHCKTPAQTHTHRIHQLRRLWGHKTRTFLTHTHTNTQKNPHTHTHKLAHRISLQFTPETRAHATASINARAHACTSSHALSFQSFSRAVEHDTGFSQPTTISTNTAQQCVFTFTKAELYLMCSILTYRIYALCRRICTENMWRIHVFYVCLYGCGYGCTYFCRALLVLKLMGR